MKKLIYCAAAFAMAFFAASCQQEMLAPAAQESTVTYTVELPGVQTKAFMGTVSKVDELIYEVWKTEAADERDLNGTSDNGNAKATLLYQKTVPMTNQRTVITLNLVQDQEYTVLFWAQKRGTGVYNTDALTDVYYAKTWNGSEDDANCLYSNQESYEAYYATEFISDGDKKSRTVVLKRPFAQLNLGTKNTQMEDTGKEFGEGEYNVEVVSSKVTVSNVGTRFNVAKNYVATPDREASIAVTGASSVTFETATDPSNIEGDATSQFEYITVSGQVYEYVAMNYLFATGDNVTVSYEINTVLSDKNNTHTTEAKVTNIVYEVPLQENYRTNIVGNLLTSTSQYEVIVDPSWDNEGQEPPYLVELWDGETIEEPEIETDATTGEQTYLIDEPSELAYIAALVNGTLSSTFSTKANVVSELNITLNADIDLNNMPWTPIGFNSNDEVGNENYFTGTFDGNGHTIKNLYIDVEDHGGVGFFGAIHNATIKNVTFENVFVKAVESENDPANTSGAEGNKKYIVGGHMGAVAGYDAEAGEITFDNVHVNGLVRIEGETRAAQGQRIGGIIGGRNSSTITFNNVSVRGAEGSFIKGYCSTAGISGQIQGVATYENVHTDIDVYAVTFGAGGIAGIVRHGSTFNNCSSAGDITLDASRTQLSSYSANYPYRIGGIAGCWSESKTGVLTLTDCSYTGTLTSIDKDGNSPEAFDYAGYVGRGYTLNGCAGSKVCINGVEYVQVYDKAAGAGLYYVNGEYTIASAANLKVFANKVNSGEDYFEGKTVKLGADIDLNNDEWTPIGSMAMDHGFMGNFEGNGKTIKNLKMTKLGLDSDGYSYAGLFGLTEGTETQENYIKNLVIENVTIETTGHIAAAAIAYSHYTTVENVTIEGDISIKGGNYTSGALAYTRRCVNAKDITVAGNEGSFIEGNNTVGGVISDIQMNGGLTANYSNFKASGLTIKGNKCVGGISGIISNQTLNGAIVENVTLVCDDNRTGIVAGAEGGKSTLTNVSYENVTGATRVIGATYDKGYYVGQILEVAGVKAIIYSIENGVKAVSVEELNLNGKYWQDAIDWAARLGEGWALASMEELNAIYDARFELNDALEVNSKDNALFWEGDEYYRKNGSVYYALYMSSTEVPVGGADANGNNYFPNRVFFKIFNKLGYSDVLYSAFDCINKYAPLRDNYFARATYTL